MSTRKTTADFDPQTLQLFDQYVHGDISRRDFLSGAARFAVGGLSALTLLEALSPDYALAQQVSPDDSNIITSYTEFSSPEGNGSVRAYLAQPKKTTGPLPLVLVVHENRGLNPYIEDVARRLAVAGFIALAPDALFTLGGYPGDEDKARALFAKLDQNKTRQDFLRSVSYLQQLKGGNGKVGVVGFCYGGGIANFLAASVPTLKAAVPFYGRQAEANQIAAIQAPLLIHYAENDERVNAGATAYDEALAAAGKQAQSFVYAGTVHGFHNDTTPRFNEAAAKLAWQRTLTFFRQQLS